MKKKIFALLLVIAMVAGLTVGFAGCKDDKEEFKIGFIFLHDENSTYDLNFINAAKAVQQELGLSSSQVILKTNIPEGNECYEAAADLVDQGCDIVFADSFGHEEFMLKAAKEFPEVQFCHATGTMAHTENIANFHNAFASIYEGRYLAGIAAGMKLNAMMANNASLVPKMGYVGAYPYAEVKSGYTSFYLGAKSVCPTVTMEVQFTGSWYDEIREKTTAETLISRGCVLISQHADSMGAPSACEENDIPNVSYNGSTIASCPDTFIVSSRIDWAPYFKYIIDCVQNGNAIDHDWSGNLSTGSVVLTAVNTAVAAEGTQAAIDAAKAKLVAGTLHVFDTTTFTVTITPDNPDTDAWDGINTNATIDATGHLTAYTADVNTDPAYTGDTQVVADGYFQESKYRSAPYFDITIDGITLLN